MMPHLHIGAVIVMCVIILRVHADNTYRLCVTNRNNLLNRCQTVKRGDSQVECVSVADSVDCALKIQQGLADFGVFTAEEALLVSNFIDPSVEVIADIRHEERLSDLYAFQAVAVVKSASYGGKLSTLKGSNFCHPGFAPGQLWTDAVLKHFERHIVSTPCEENIPVVEQEIKALSTFFNSACRPGPWMIDDMFDNRLKLNYSNLCDLCDSPKTCSYASNEAGTHLAALTCLTHRGGDVAYVALRYVRQYFGLEAGFSPRAELNQFEFLYPDGSTEPLDTIAPKAWINQPWSGVLARRDIRLSLQPLLLAWLSSDADARPAWQQALSDLMLENDHKLVSVTSRLSNFVRQSGETRQACKGDVKWCTSSPTETRKCEWLKTAVQTHGIQPSINCVQANSNWQCWAHVRDGTADIVTVDTEYGYITRRSFNLSPLAYLDSGISGNFQILAIISSANKHIRGWNNIRQKKACFPEFGGLAWTSVVATLSQNRQLPRACPYAQAMGSYLAGACAPGAKDVEHTRGSEPVPARLCSVCSTQNSSDACSTSASNVFYGDLGALRCLTPGFGDIAFVDYRQLAGRDGVLASDIEPSSYRVLCRNGSLAQTVGLNVDNDCALAYGVGSEIVARSDRSDTRNLELTELLLELDQWFGSTSPSKMDSVFHMYSEFQGTKDLLFKDSTRGLILPNDSGYSYVNSYKKLQDLNSVCVKSRSSADAVWPSLIVLSAVIISPFLL